MNALTIALKYGPLVFSTVRTIEAALPDSAGKQKLDAAIALITTLQADLANALPGLTQLISGVVSALNAAGVFTKKTASASPAA